MSMARRNFAADRYVFGIAVDFDLQINFRSA
jgi:hypothetical protein